MKKKQENEAKKKGRVEDKQGEEGKELMSLKSKRDAEEEEVKKKTRDKGEAEEGGGEKREKNELVRKREN